MKRKIFLYTAVIGLMGGLLASCNPNPYGAKNSEYYKRMSNKFQVVDQHVDCPIIVKPPSKRKKR